MEKIQRLTILEKKSIRFSVAIFEFANFNALKEQLRVSFSHKLILVRRYTYFTPLALTLTLLPPQYETTISSFLFLRLEFFFEKYFLKSILFYKIKFNKVLGKET